MVSLIVVFWMYVVLFAIIGGMRGWAKELLVTFSVILALTFTTLLSSYVPFVRMSCKRTARRFTSGCAPSSWACWSSSATRPPTSRASPPR